LEDREQPESNVNVDRAVVFESFGERHHAILQALYLLQRRPFARIVEQDQQPSFDPGGLGRRIDGEAIVASINLSSGFFEGPIRVA
jgi:hypothetical protein